MPGNLVRMEPSEIYQTIEGFGAGIKRRTEHLYALNNSVREQIETYCFKDLEVNMIRFFVYHDLEPENDNVDSATIDTRFLERGVYIISSYSNNTKQLSNLKFIKQ